MVEIKDVLLFIVGISASFLMWNLKTTMIRRDKKIDIIENDIHEIKESLPKDYVSKEDYKTDIKDLKAGVNDIRKFIMEKGN